MPLWKSTDVMLSSTPKTDNQERERLDKYMNAMLDLLYLTSARSALADCRGRDNNGSYDAGEFLS